MSVEEKGKEDGFLSDGLRISPPLLLPILLGGITSDQQRKGTSLLLTSMSSRRNPRASLPASKERFSPPSPPSPADDFLLLFDEEDGSWPTDCFRV